MTALTPDFGRRLAALRQAMEALGIDAMAVASETNRRYLSGFAGTEATLVVTATERVLITDFRYIEQAATQCPGWQVVRFEGSAWATVRDIANRLGVRRLGVEAEHLTLAAEAVLADGLRPERVATTGVVAVLRAVKDAFEIERLRDAVRVAQEALSSVVAGSWAGEREVSLARALEVAMLQGGAEAKAFTFIVASGPRAAMPHGVASDKTLAPGEAVTIDFGARVAGYHSDLTRTFAVAGDAPASVVALHALVETAQAAAMEAVRPGRTGGEVDQVARDLIGRAGYGAMFGHGLGHGIGLDVHELPRVRQGSRDVLSPGMVITVEPGVYVPGLGGVRIEDELLVTENGAERLSTLGRGLLCIGERPRSGSQRKGGST